MEEEERIAPIVGVSWAVFDEKVWNLNNLTKIVAKKLNRNSRQNFFVFLKNSTVLLLTIFSCLTKIDEILGKNSGKWE